MRIQRNIALYGVVEGVGMRPALYRFSAEYGLKGYAVNHADHVDLTWQGEETVLLEALKKLPDILPEDCRVSVSVPSENQEFKDFSFRHAPRSCYAVNLAAPPDRVPCADCLAEISDPRNRRFRYAFNACGVCGPRTTVMEAMPYDRENTAWNDFPLCPDCLREYGDPADRRFHIQGISCPKCGPRLELFDAARNRIETDDPAGYSAEAISNGRILALKGIGGFQLICSLHSAPLLRSRKHRPDKPFALMADSLETVRRLFELSEKEERLLTSPAGPAVLLKWKTEPDAPVAPDSPGTAAVMLPSSPLHKILISNTKEKIVIATSGNLSGLPPALDTETALRELLPAADLLLTHSRRILRRNDDSVCAVVADEPQVWRRARGFSSVFSRPFRRRLLAAGAGMKNTFAISDHDRFFISSHFGELDDIRAYRAWCDAVRASVAGFRSEPEEIVCDLHPDYPSSRFAEQLARERGIPLRKAPHHCAHALAAMLDAGLRRALVFVFDGTGLGTDGVLRGAELFDMDLDRECRHAARWDAVPLPGGDHAVIHPYIQLAARRIAADSQAATRHVAPEQTALLKIQCEKRWNTPLTASAGRLFDSVSALCGLAPETVTYDGQAAVRLENAACRETAISVQASPDYFEEEGVMTVSWMPLFRADAPEVSPRGFHESVADAMIRMADFALQTAAHPVRDVLLTGGVFQNRLLAGLARKKLESKGFSCRLPGGIPAGDGGISCGQLMWGEQRMEMKNGAVFAPGGPF